MTMITICNDPRSATQQAARRLRILVVHNRYREAGGEDSVVASEVALLRANGVEVFEHTVSNASISDAWPVASAASAVWSRTSFRKISDLLSSLRPDLVHFHNTFPIISPSAYWAVAKAGIPVVQTLHNFRILCPGALLYRGDQVCEQCIGRVPWRAVIHRCYRGSRGASAVASAMLVANRAAGTYVNKVNAYIALNEFCRDKFVAGGLPADKLHIKPNFVEDPGVSRCPRRGYLFVGRLSREKGIGVVGEAFRELSNVRLDVVGEGGEADQLAGIVGVRMLGRRSSADIAQLMMGATALVVASVWYENYPRVIVEAMSCGLPVIASKLGALEEIVEHGKTGLLFTPGCSQALREVVTWAEEHPEEMARMGENARARYEQEFTPQRNFQKMLEIYRRAGLELSRKDGLV